MPSTEDIGEGHVHLVPQLPCSNSGKLGRPRFHEAREAMVDRLATVEVSKGSLVDHDKRVETGVEGALETPLPLASVGLIVPERPVQGIANVPQPEVYHRSYALRVQPVHANSDL